MHHNNIFGLLVIVAYFQAVIAQYYSCLTPYNSYGRCVPHHECKFLQKLLTHYGTLLPQNYITDMRRSLCKANMPGIHICCDDTLSPILYPIQTEANLHTSGGHENMEKMEDYTSSMNEEGLNILRAQKCGGAGGERVSHGQNVDLFEFPWMALLIYNSNEDRFKCGGSLITDRFVLTAAHCMVSVREKIVGVRLGEHDVSKEMDCITLKSRPICAPPVEDIGVEKTIPHPDFNNAHKTNDVALVKLSRSVQFKKHIKPICLPIIPDAAEIPKDRRFFIAGWGGTENNRTSDILQKALVPFKTHEQCQQIFRRTRINENHLCAGGDGLIDTCKGDSGGPLFYLAPYSGARKSPRYVQYGIVSFGGAECGSDRNYPGIYANVANFMPWITSQIATN